MSEKEILLARYFAMLTMVHAVITMTLDIFYREFTKFSGFTGKTSSSFLHTHYFALGMVFFLIQMLLEETLAFSDRNSGKLLLVHQLGLSITGLGFSLRGMSQVLGNELSRGMDASVPGISGIGHILLGTDMSSLLLQVWRTTNGINAEQNQDGALRDQCSATRFLQFSGREPVGLGNGIHYDGGGTQEEGLYTQRRE